MPSVTQSTSERLVVVTDQVTRVEVARIFGEEWYREDFGGSLTGVGAFWAKYLPSGPAKELVRSGKFKWVDTDYDWRINIRR